MFSRLQMVWIEEYAREKNEEYAYLLHAREQNDCRPERVWNKHCYYSKVKSMARKEKNILYVAPLLPISATTLILFLPFYQVKLDVIKSNLEARLCFSPYTY